MDESKTQPLKEERRSKEKIKKSAFKGSENIAHTINRNKEEMIEGISSCSEGICFQVGSIFSVRSNLNHLLPFSLHYFSGLLLVYI